MRNFIVSLLLTIPVFGWGQLTQGQLVHYSFNGNTQDISLNSVHATEVNNPVYVADANGNSNSALSLDGINQRIDLPASSVIRPSSFPITFSFWFKVSSFSNFGSKLFFSNFSSSSHNGYYCQVKNNSLELSFGDGNGLGSQNRRSFFINQTFQTNTWYHIVFIVTGQSQATAWVNCQLVNITTSGLGGNIIYGNSPGHMGMGRQNTVTNAPYYFHGVLDEFRIWNRVLSSIEVSQLCTPCSNDSTYLSESICNGSTYNFNGQILSTPGLYSDQLTNSSGCDSLVTLDLSQTSVDTSVIQTGSSLFAVNQADSWQWINCENNQPITGETGPSYTPLINGAYAVIVEQDGCTDTSNCFNVSDISLFEHNTLIVNAYPNPHQGQISIDLPENVKKIAWVISDLQGRVITEKTISTSEYQQQIDLPNTICILQIWLDDEYQGRQLLLPAY